MVPGFKKVTKDIFATALHDGMLVEQLKKMGLLLAGLLFLHVVAMMAFEGMRLGDSLWLTFTSATTVGYGDLSAKTFLGRISTVLLIYIGGIFLLAQSAALYFEYRQYRRHRMLVGQWSWTMENHIVFLNCPEEGSEAYYTRALQQLRASRMDLAKAPVVIVSEKFPNGLPPALTAMDVYHVHKCVSQPSAFQDANVVRARAIFIHARNTSDPLSDSVTFDVVDRLRTIGVKAHIVAEVVNDENRARLKKVGANNVLRPIRQYPEMIIRALLAPGSEQVIETLFNGEGEEVIRVEVPFSGHWRDVVLCLLNNDYGTPIAYEDTKHKIHKSPTANEPFDAIAFFVIVREAQMGLRREIAAALARVK